MVLLFFLVLPLLEDEYKTEGCCYRQIVIPKKIREILGLIKGNKLKIFQENKKIILIVEPDMKQSELFVSASPYATDRAKKASHEIDEKKINDLLLDLGIK